MKQAPSQTGFNAEVWKFTLQLSELDDIVAINMPRGAKPLSVANQNETLVLYAMVDPELPVVSREFRVAGTGHPLTNIPKMKNFLGTVLFREGSLVFHVWEL